MVSSTGMPDAGTGTTGATGSTPSATAAQSDDGSSASSEDPPDVTSAVAAISDSWRVAGALALFIGGLAVALLISQARARGAHRRH